MNALDSPNNQDEQNYLPRGWVQTTVGTVFTVVGGGTPSTARTDYWDGSIPWITSADIDEGGRISPRKKITEQGIADSATNKVPPGSVIVVTRVGLGKVGLAHEELCFSQDSQGLIFSDHHCYPPFVAYQMQVLVSVFKHISRGTTISGVTKKQLLDLNFKLPPLAEQYRIVAEIETQFTRLDAAVAALWRVQANLKRYRASVLQAACEGRLVPTEAELARVEGRSYEPADQLLQRILQERRAKWEAEQLAHMQAQSKMPKDERWKSRYKEPVALDTSELPELPEGWVWATVEQLGADQANAITDGPFGSNLKTAHYTSSGPRVIRLQNIGDGVFIDAYAHISQEHYESLLKHRIEAGDLVIAALGERPPRACIIPSSVGPAIVKADCIRFKPEPRLVLAKFLNCALNAEPTRARTTSIVHGIGRPRLNLGEVKALLLPLPPLVEQHCIVAEVERRLSVIDELETAIAANLKRAERLRQAILKRAFEGKLVPQDPTDEPASVLLERIRAERAQPKATPKAPQKSTSPPHTVQPTITIPAQGELALHYRA